MFSKKIRLDTKGKSVSVATALVLLAINELIEEDNDLDWIYGYQIMTHLKETYHWEKVKSGTVYPILKKLDEDNYIKRVIGPDTKRKSKRQTIYYKITNRGKKLATKIESLNDDALEAALASTGAKNQRTISILPNGEGFPERNFTNLILIPFLLNFDNQISELIDPEITPSQSESIKNELLKSIEEIKDFEKILNIHLTKLKKIESMQIEKTDQSDYEIQ